MKNLKGGKMVQFNFDISDERHHKFKAACALKGINMRKRIEQLIEEDIEKR